jgi:Phasin protein
MAKPNVHTASRDELVEAGVRAELVDEILKRRRKGAIRLEELDQVPGVGPATLEQLRQALDFREQQAAPSNNGNGNGSGGRANEQQQREQADQHARSQEGGGSDERRREEEATARTAEATVAATGSTARLGVKVARDTTAAGAEATGEAARSGLQIVRRTADAAGEATRAAGEVTRQSAEGTSELGRVLTELVQEQTRHNLATLRKLGEVVDWERLLQIQSEYLRTSLERMAGLTQRYLEASQAVLTAAAKVGEFGRRNRGGSKAA